MWIKDIRNYDIEVYKDDNMIYSGNVDNAPEEIKQYEAESAKIEHKKIKITVK